MDGDVKPTFQQMTFMPDGYVDFPELGPVEICSRPDLSDPALLGRAIFSVAARAGARHAEPWLKSGNASWEKLLISERKGRSCKSWLARPTWEPL